MQKRVLLVAAFAVLLSGVVFGVGTPAPVSAAAGRTLIGFQNQAGLNAMANFVQPLGDGNERFVGVFAMRDRLQTEPGKPLRGAGVGVVVAEGNLQTGSITFVAMGHADVPGLAIDRQLRGAHLPLTTVTMDVFNPMTVEPTGATFPLQIDVTWTGTGAVAASHFVSHFRLPGMMELTRANGKERAATAVANTLTFTEPGGTGVTVSGATDEHAGLLNTHFMDIIITRQM